MITITYHCACGASWTGGENVPVKCPECGKDAVGAVCEHGEALDVHCCHCHSGFIFDPSHECHPRRCRMDRITPTEQAIYGAVAAVEAMPADVRLTDAVILLQAARESVADFIDGVETRRYVSLENVEQLGRELANRSVLELAATERARKAEAFLERADYRHCDIAARGALHPSGADPMSPSERNGKRLLFKVPLGKKTLLVRRGNYSRRLVVPFIERGPARTWLASWSYGQVSLELTRLL